MVRGRACTISSHGCVKSWAKQSVSNPKCCNAWAKRTRTSNRAACSQNSSKGWEKDAAAPVWEQSSVNGRGSHSRPSKVYVRSAVSTHSALVCDVCRPSSLMAWQIPRKGKLSSPPQRKAAPAQKLELSKPVVSYSEMQGPS
eukprot:scaffold4876_cov177-Amphora_coffeaeformis.AAC.5